MKGMGLYFSPTGTTMKAVMKTFESMGIEGELYDIADPKQRKSLPVIGDGEVVLVGAPVYSGRIPLLVETYLKGLRLKNNPVVILGVYGNRAYEDALLEMKDILEQRGGVVSGAAAVVAEHSYSSLLAGGRPDKEDLMKIEAFARETLGNIDKGIRVSVPGNRPYRERKPRTPMGPVTDESCTQCRLCAKSCPVEAIDFEDCRIVDENQCISCQRCIHICPAGAKIFDPRITPMVEKLVKDWGGVRREPEFFLTRALED